MIPTMLAEGKRMFAYGFKGYWKDVGTVTSLWEANMDLLGEKPVLSLSDRTQKVYSRNEPLPPSFIGGKAKVENSILTTGCEIHGTVKNSVIGEGVVIGEGSVIEDSVVMARTVIGKNTHISYAMIDEKVVIEDGVTIGDEKADKMHIALVGGGCTVKKGTKVESGQIVE